MKNGKYERYTPPDDTFFALHLLNPGIDVISGLSADETKERYKNIRLKEGESIQLWRAMRPGETVHQKVAERSREVSNVK